MAQIKLKKRLLALGAIVGCVLAGLLVLLYIKTRPQKLIADEHVQKAFELVASTNSYAQLVETQTTIGDRALFITGSYKVDTQNHAYAASSTTTLLIGNDPRPHTFSHQNISIKDMVYTKVNTEDPFLQNSIQSIPAWQSFKSTEIPHNLESIVIPGAIQDNLLVFSHSGEYLQFKGNLGTPNLSSTSTLTYSFTLSPKAFSVEDGPLRAVVSRIGHTGTINVWLDPTTDEIHSLVFENPPYYSTTTISSRNMPLRISPPIPAKL